MMVRYEWPVKVLAGLRIQKRDRETYFETNVSENRLDDRAVFERNGFRLNDALVRAFRYCRHRRCRCLHAYNVFAILLRRWRLRS